MIRTVNWNPRTPVPLPTAVKVLSSLEVSFTAALAPQNAFLPQLVWVSCAPATPPVTAAPVLAPILGLHGTTTISGNLLVWKLTDPPAAVTNMLKGGGVIMVDLDCDYLQDASGVAVSGSAGPLAGIKPPVRPGGIFRSWIQVLAG
jgi:hypothetical protein